MLVDSFKSWYYGGFIFIKAVCKCSVSFLVPKAFSVPSLILLAFASVRQCSSSGASHPSVSGISR